MRLKREYGKKENSMMWASDFRVAMRVFTCIAAFFCGVTLSVASGEDRQRGAETILEDHWILDQVRT